MVEWHAVCTKAKVAKGGAYLWDTTVHTDDFHIYVQAGMGEGNGEGEGKRKGGETEGREGEKREVGRGRKKSK